MFESECALQACVSISVCVCVGVPSASRNAWVPPKLRWLPSAKMAARIPQSDSAQERKRQNQCERNWGRKTWRILCRMKDECCEKERKEALPRVSLFPERWGALGFFLFSWFWHATDWVNSAPVCWHVTQHCHPRLGHWFGFRRCWDWGA